MTAPRRGFRYLAIAAATILVVLSLNGVWLLWGFRRSAEEPLPRVEEVLAKQIAAVEEGNSETIQITDRVVRDADIRPLQGLAGLRSLMLDSGALTDAGMETVASLPDLGHLRLRDSPITDGGLARLRGNENLRVLNLPQARVSADGLAQLSVLPRLRQIRIGGGEMGDLSRGVAQLTSLRSVHLIDVPVTDDGLKQIASLPHLESLYLDGPVVTEAGWQWLFENHPQLHVHLNQQHHDRDPARHPHGDAGLGP